ncbi:hypothetical protein ACBQ54_10915 [Providencia vermicola]|uniref:hypothetical protein n=1 Tax=Providencia vermicola TaxID=333965 RepID=UPI0035232258
MEGNKLEGNKYFLDLKENYQYINEKIRRLYLGLDSLTEEILIIESKHQNIFDDNSYQNKTQLTDVEYIQPKNYIKRIKDYIHIVKGVLDKYQKLQDKLMFYIENPSEIKNITPNIAEDYTNLANSIRNYPFIGSQFNRLLFKFDYNISQLVIDAKEYTLTFHSSVADLRYAAHDVSYAIDYLQHDDVLDVGDDINNPENDMNKKEGVSNQDNIKLERRSDDGHLAESMVGFLRGQPLSFQAVSYFDVITSILPPMPIY